MFDTHLHRPRKAGLECLLLKRNTVVLYFLIIMLLSHTLNAVQHVLKIFDQFAVDFDVKCNSSKRGAMRIGCRYDFLLCHLYVVCCAAFYAK